MWGDMWMKILIRVPQKYNTWTGKCSHEKWFQWLSEAFSNYLEHCRISRAYWIVMILDFWNTSIIKNVSLWTTTGSYAGWWLFSMCLDSERNNDKQCSAGQWLPHLRQGSILGRYPLGPFWCRAPGGDFGIHKYTLILVLVYWRHYT